MVAELKVRNTQATFGSLPEQREDMGRPFGKDLSKDTKKTKSRHGYSGETV